MLKQLDFIQLTLPETRLHSFSDVGLLSFLMRNFLLKSDLIGLTVGTIVGSVISAANLGMGDLKAALSAAFVNRVRLVRQTFCKPTPSTFFGL